MTHNETRDELARMDGAYFSIDREMGPIGWCDKNGTLIGDHPHAPTLDGANAAMNATGYAWERTPFEWWGWKPGSRVDDPVKVDDTGPGNEMDDLYALALACRRAMEERK